MKTNTKSPKTMAIMAASVVLIAFLGTAFYHANVKKDWMKSLNDEKVKSEMLAAEKSKLEKDIEGIQNELAGLKTQNQGLNAELDASKKETIRYKGAVVSNASSKKTIAQMKKELETLRATKTSLTKELADAKAKLKGMEGQNTDLQNEIAKLTSNNKKLTDDLSSLKSMASDNYQVTAYKGKNNKLTVNSKKVKDITTMFTIPSYVAANASFKIKTPDGQTIDKTAKGMSMTILDDIEELYASVDGIKGSETMKKVQVSYKPETKLKTGPYRVELYNGANYVASCIIQLK